MLGVLLFVGMNFNVCKWLCFLHLALFLPFCHLALYCSHPSFFLTCVCDIQLPPNHPPPSALRVGNEGPAEHPFTTCEGPGRWTTKKHLGCWVFFHLKTNESVFSNTRSLWIMAKDVKRTTFSLYELTVTLGRRRKCD